MKKLITGFGIVVLSFTCLAVFASNDKGNVNSTPGTLKWELKVADGNSGARPAIGINRMIYTGCSNINAHVYAITFDGAINWAYSLNGRNGSNTIDQHGNIYTTANNLLYAINPSGILKWSFSSSSYLRPPSIDKNGTIYTGTDAINPDGTLKWSFKTEKLVLSSPAIDKYDNIYFGGQDGYLYALNSSGNLKWKFNTGTVDYSSPAIDKEGTIYIGSTGEQALFAINPNGTLKWKFKTTGAMNSSPAIGRDGTIYIGSGDSYFYAVNSNGTLKWKLKLGRILNSSPAIGDDGTIYIGADTHLYAINSDGTLQWKYNTNGLTWHSPTIGPDGTIYIESMDGYLYAINSSSKMLDPLAPWPQYHKDLNQSGCFGNGYRYYIGDNQVECEHNVTINSDEYYKMTWDARRIKVLKNFKAEVNFSVGSHPEIHYRIDYNTALPCVKKYSSTHIGLPLHVATNGKVTCEKWYNYKIDIMKDAEKYFSSKPNMIYSVNFMNSVGLGNVEIKDLILYY